MNQITVGWWEMKPNLKTSSPTPLPSSQAQLDSWFSVHPLIISSTKKQGMGVAVSSLLVSAALSSSRGELLTPFPCSRMGASHRTVLYKLLQHESFIFWLCSSSFFPAVYYFLMHLSFSLFLETASWNIPKKCVRKITAKQCGWLLV